MIVIGIFFEFYMYFQLVSNNAKINNVYKILFLGLCFATNIFCFIAFLAILLFGFVFFFTMLITVDNYFGR